MFIVSLLSALISIYSILILIRIIMSWFSSMVGGKFIAFLEYITDPYLNWWRRNFNFRIGVIDFSAILGLTALSVAQNILMTISLTKTVSIGIILAIVLSALWSVAAFIIGFFIILIILRLIAYLTNRDIYSGFWQLIDSITQPLLYRINRIFFGDSINNYMTGIIIAIVLLIVIRIAGSILISILIGILRALPV